MRNFYIAMALFYLSANLSCAKFKNDDLESVVDSNLQPTNVSSKNLNDYVKIEVTPTATPEKYLVYFRWPKLTDPTRIRIRNSDTLSIVAANQTTFSHVVNHNQNLSYTFDILDENNQIQKTFTKLVSIPKDFVVNEKSNQISENSIIKVQRVFLNRDTSLFTNGFDIELITNELISDNGKIETFPVEAVGNIGSDGKSGGNILINAEHASGQLSISMRGQKGGPGLKGEPYPTRAQDGAPPQEGYMECVCPRCDRFSIWKILMDEPINPSGCYCANRGSNGTSGWPGAKGRKGGQAGVGGDAGNLKVVIDEGKAFSLISENFPGKSGEPGEGGDGQPGGIALGHKSMCSGDVGGNGPPGPRGDTGDLAADGKIGSTCIYIASEGKNECY